MPVDNYFITQPKSTEAQARGIRSYRIRLNGLSPAMLVQDLRMATLRLTDAIDLIQRSLQQPSFGFDYRGGLEGDLKFLKTYGALYLHRGDTVPGRSHPETETLLDFLHIIRTNNQVALDKALRQEPYSGMIYTVGDKGQISTHLFASPSHPYGHKNGEPWAIFQEIEVVDGYMCDRCGNAIAESDRLYHRAHPGCNVKVMCREAEKTLVKVDFETGLAARMADLPNVMVPTKHDVWVEPWVAEAAKIFQNRGEDGYADLTLDQFLAKSRPSPAPGLQEETP